MLCFATAASTAANRAECDALDGFAPMHQRSAAAKDARGTALYGSMTCAASNASGCVQHLFMQVPPMPFVEECWQ